VLAEDLKPIAEAARPMYERLATYKLSGAGSRAASVP
jgi:hypothetical protein